jgi:hypothetical protein
MTAQDRPWIRLFHVTCGLLLITTAAGCRHHHKQPPPPICNSTQQNGTNGLSASASAIVEEYEFSATYTHSLAISAASVAGASAGHLVVQRKERHHHGEPPETVLQIDTQESPNGATQVMASYGKGFSGVKQITLTSSDQATVQGTIDGRSLAPFPIHASFKSVKFADGSALPAMDAGDETRRALPILMEAMGGQCTQTTGLTASAARTPSGDRNGGSDPPAHPPNFDQAPCILCTLGCVAYNIACIGQALYTATLCGPGYPFCLAGELAGCELSTVACYGNTSETIPGINVTVGACHLNGTPGASPGPPCCPVGCGSGSSSFCCGPGESCAGPGPGPFPALCCPSGLTGCGTNCCVAGQSCLPNSVCCPNASVCGSICCSASQTCLTITPPPFPITECCPSAQVCGKSCCGPTDTCLNGACCPAANKVCGGVCCPDPNDICDPNTNKCVLACPGGTQACGGTCCTSGQLCCFVSTPPNTVGMQCVVPLGPLKGNPNNPWCGKADPADSSISCNNCAPNQQCASVKSGVLVSIDHWCQ